MNERIAERGKRVPETNLSVFLRSHAPDVFKAEAQDILGQLAPWGMSRIALSDCPAITEIDGFPASSSGGL